MGVDSPNIDTLDRWAFEVTKVEKPWGHELIWALTDVYCGKVLFVKAGHSLSLAVPPREGRVVARPVRPREARARRGGGDDAEAGGDRRRAPRSTMPPGTVHRVTAIEDTTILEVSTPQLDDVVRLEDAYGREGTSAA